MKIIILGLACLFTGVLSNAQDPDYTGPAKVPVKGFWDGAAKLEKSMAGGGSSMDADNLSNLQRKIADIKKRDAAYNTGEMELKFKTLSEGIEGLKKKHGAAIQANRDKTLNMQNVDKILRSLFHISTQVDRGGLKTIKEVIESYRNRTNEVMAMDKSTNKNDLERYRVALKGNFKVAENDIYELDRRCREQTDPANAEVNYYEVLYKQAFWDAAQKIYPAEPDFATAYATATKVIEGLGSVTDVHAIASKSREQKIKDTRLPAAVVKDPALEKMFVDAFNTQYKEEFKGTAIKAVVLSNEWGIERNELTGIVTGRVRRGSIVYKGTNGKCYLTSNFFIHQEYVGNSFMNTKSVYVVMGSQEMLCEHVK
ncbi:MAG: hypothetical protein H7Y01_11895 [Ferruginibacter sp.]|nr:hypothetical protein [Chitinophagaceae bacterium]